MCDNDNERLSPVSSSIIQINRADVQLLHEMRDNESAYFWTSTICTGFYDRQYLFHSMILVTTTQNLGRAILCMFSSRFLAHGHSEKYLNRLQICLVRISVSPS